jgi:hypothetical protein
VVPSRVPVAIGAWLLGALTATGGSLLAVDQLAQGLLEQRTKQVSVGMVNAELALENSEPASAAPAASPSPSASSAAGSKPNAARRSAGVHGKTAAPRPDPSDTGKLLTSAGGTAVATCEDGRARLLYWSPAQGFAVFRVEPGPSLIVSVTFTDSSEGIVMHVACGTSGVPVAHTATWQWGGGGSHHDE